MIAMILKYNNLLYSIKKYINIKSTMYGQINSRDAEMQATICRMLLQTAFVNIHANKQDSKKITLMLQLSICKCNTN